MDVSQQRQHLDSKDLLDLFKHWDTRVSHQETLFVPLAAAVIPAIIVKWQDVTPFLISVAAAVSLAVYLFYLFAVHRLGAFQDNVFAALKNRDSDIDRIVRGPKRQVGIRRIRIIFFLFLCILWTIVLAAKLDESKATVGVQWYVAIAVFLLFALALSWYLWRRASPAHIIVP